MDFQEVACEQGNCQSMASDFLFEGDAINFVRAREASKRLAVSWLAPAHVLEELEDEEVY
jgi:hypothetical protein